MILLVTLAVNTLFLAWKTGIESIAVRSVGTSSCLVVTWRALKQRIPLKRIEHRDSTNSIIEINMV